MTNLMLVTLGDSYPSPELCHTQFWGLVEAKLG